MARWVLLIVAGCSSSPKPPPGGWAPLPPEKAVPPSDAAVLAPEVEAVATNALGSFDEAPVFELAGSPCMPAGAYTVTFDLSTAKFDARGMDHQHCVEMATAIPRDQLGAMTLSFEGGTLAVDWPDRKNAIAVKTCSFSLQGPPVAAQVTFADGAGSGTATYAYRTPSHLDERCTVRDVKLSISRT